MERTRGARTAVSTICGFGLLIVLFLGVSAAPAGAQGGDSCTVTDNGDGSLTLTWSLVSPGTPVVLRDGIFQANVEGLTSWTDTSPPPDPTYVIRIWTATSLDVPCDATTTPPPETSIPWYDTAWHLPEYANNETQVDIYFNHLRDTGYEGVFISLLPSLQGQLGQIVVKTGQVGATLNPGTGNVDINPAQITWVNSILDRAHARGLKVNLVAAWASSYLNNWDAQGCHPGGGPINAGNANNFGTQIGQAFGTHPAIGYWVLGGDNWCDPNPDVNVWSQMEAGIRSVGATQPVGYFPSGATPEKFLNETWNDAQLVQTGHCAPTNSAVNTLNNVIAIAGGKTVVALELRYEDIEPNWSNPCPRVTAQNVIDDANAVLTQTGIDAIVYGHNERWQWSRGAHGSSGQQWPGVQASFGAPGELGVLAALTQPPDQPPEILTASADPTAGAAPLAVSFSSTATDPDGDPVSFEWDFGDGQTSSEQNPLHSYSDIGTYNAQLTVTANGLTAVSAPITITVTTAVDDTAPNSAITDPGLVPLGVVSVSGTATDDLSGVARVRVRTRRLSDGLYWDGSTWVASANNWRLAAGTTAWSLDVPMDAAGTYQVVAYAVDAAGNVELWADGRPTLNIIAGMADLEAPNTAIDDPGVVAVGSVSITGTASDALSSVTAVRVRVRRVADGMYWDGATWGPASNKWIKATGTTSWSLDVPMDTAGIYRVWAFARDSAGNVETWADGRPAINIGVGVAPDVVPPNTTIDDPGPVPVGIVSISGTASDDDSGVAKVKVRVQRLSDGMYWDGTAWVSPANQWLKASGTTTWTLDVPMDSAGVYRVWAYSVDVVANVETWADGRPSLDITAI